jgi:hypothetical protein
MAGNITTIVSLPLSEEASLQSTIAGIKEIDGVAEVYYGRREEDKEIVTLAVGELQLFDALFDTASNGGL